jgi:hypothetical protein
MSGRQQDWTGEAGIYPSGGSSKASTRPVPLVQGGGSRKVDELVIQSVHGDADRIGPGPHLGHFDRVGHGKNLGRREVRCGAPRVVDLIGKTEMATIVEIQHEDRIPRRRHPTGAVIRELGQLGIGAIVEGDEIGRETRGVVLLEIITGDDSGLVLNDQVVNLPRRQGGGGHGHGVPTGRGGHQAAREENAAGRPGDVGLKAHRIGGPRTHDTSIHPELGDRKGPGHRKAVGSLKGCPVQDVLRPRINSGLVSEIVLGLGG